MNGNIIKFTGKQISLRRDENRKDSRYLCQDCNEKRDTFYLAAYGQWVCVSCISEMLDSIELKWCRELNRPASRYVELCPYHNEKTDHKHDAIDILEQMERYCNLDSLDVQVEKFFKE